MSQYSFHQKSLTLAMGSRSMRNAISVFNIVVLVAMCMAPGAAGGDDREDAVDELFRRWSNVHSPGATIAIVRDGRLLYSKGYGMANLEHDIENSPQSIFHVASVSKQFTAFAIFLLQDQGKLSLDDDIRKHLPEIHDFGSTITIRNLIQHTSGLRDQWDLLVLAGWRMDDVITHGDVMELVKRQTELNFKPGDQYLYCNTGYTLLAEIVRRVSGESLRIFCQKQIFEPLEMNDTHFHDDHRRIVPHRTDCYSKRGRGWRKAVLSYAIVGATSLFTTAEDLAKWQTNFESKALGSDAVFENVFRKGVLNNGSEIIYAGGLFYGKLGSHLTVGHSGGDAAYNCNIVRIPEQKLSVIVLANTSNLPTASLSNQIAKLFLDDTAQDESTEEVDDSPSNRSQSDKREQAAGVRPNLKTATVQTQLSPRPDRQSEPPTLLPVADLAGNYYCPELDVSYLFEVNQANGLNLVRRKYGSPRCMSLGENKYSVGSGIRMTLEFQSDPSNDDEITLFINSNRVKRLRFKKQ